MRCSRRRRTRSPTRPTRSSCSTSLQRSVREPDDEHPFGYGQERFLWAFVAAIGIFVAGAGFSLYQGLEAILSDGEDPSFGIAYAVLAVAVVAEGISLVRAYRQTSGEAQGRGLSLHVHLRASRDPTTKTVLFEDSAAVTGNVVAIAGVALHQITGNAVFEGIAALIVAAMLVIAAFLLGRDASSLLVGRAATPEERATILEVLRRPPEVEDVLQLLTMALGPGPPARRRPRRPHGGRRLRADRGRVVGDRPRAAPPAAGGRGGLHRRDRQRALQEGEPAAAGALRSAHIAAWSLSPASRQACSYSQAATARPRTMMWSSR